MYKILFFITALIFINSTNAQELKSIDKIIAIVGNEVLLQSTLEKQLVAFKEENPTETENTCFVLEEILFQKLMLNQAVLDSVVATDSQVEGEIDRRLGQMIAQIGSKKKLEVYFKKSMAEIKEEFRGLIKDQIIVQQMQQNITADVLITPKKIKQFFNESPKDSLPEIPEKIEIAQIMIKAKSSAASEKIARDQIENIRKRISEGEDFSTLAILYSQDGSAGKGGELGFLGKAELEPLFSAMAFSLKTKKVSDVIQTKHGFHIIELIERRGKKINVRHILIKPKVDESQLLKTKELADSIHQIILQDSISFEKAAIKYSDDLESKNSDGIIRNPLNNTTVFETTELAPQLAYSLKDLKEKEIGTSIPFTLPDGTRGHRILKLISKTPAHKMNLKDDYELIKELALNDEKRKEINKWIASKLSSTATSVNDDFKDCELKNAWRSSALETNKK